MTDFKHTKKIICDCLSIEGSNAHDTDDLVNTYSDWYYEQVEAGLADPNLVWWDVCVKISDTEYSLLVTDQTQADSIIAKVQKTADNIGYPVKFTVMDYTE
jgi:hypothetical protein